ncbi:MAG: DUF202 domain-containing protein [Planctomycetaceae bacterium]|nr:DUF202 domain-containing protein [Planctomycetaceae bacterium]
MPNTTESVVAVAETTDPRVYFAAERTLLAWIRTGLSLMGFGFVVARFGLFLQELAIADVKLEVPRYRLSPWVGVTLVLLGVIVNLGAALKHRQTVARLQRNEPILLTKNSLGVITAGVLTLLGLVMVVWLVILSQS